MSAYITMTGDLLAITHGTILHQVNCRGVAGGLAGALQRQYPMAFTDYFLLCEKYGHRNLGTFHEGHANRHLSIVHVFGQVDPGANTNLRAVEDALVALFQTDRPLLHPVYIPYKMGCGLGGGNWPAYRALLNTYAPHAIVVIRPQDLRHESTAELTPS